MTNRFLRLASVLLLAAACLHAQMTPETRRKAAALVAQLERIQAEQRRPNARKGRTLALTEADLNDYIAYRIESTGERHIKTCQVKIIRSNWIEGKLLIDLGGNPVPLLLPPQVELFFSAGVETRDGRIKINMDNLFVGTQKISPTVIDSVIAIVSRTEGVQPTSLQDWYELPYGIRKIDSKKGSLTLRY